MGYSPRGCKELDMTERLSAHTHTNTQSKKLSPDQYLSYAAGTRGCVDLLKQENTFGTADVNGVTTWLHL